MKAKRPVLPHPTDPSAALVQLTRGFWAVIDAADAESVGRFNWIVRTEKGSRTAYAFRGTWDNGRQGTEGLHRFIGKNMGLPMELQVDHRNGNGLDCRRANLRSATPGQNMANSRRRIDNVSGVKGVRWHAQDRKWEGRVKHAGKLHLVGLFDSVESARVAVEAKRSELHGDFANHGN